MSGLYVSLLSIMQKYLIDFYSLKQFCKGRVTRGSYSFALLYYYIVLPLFVWVAIAPFFVSADGAITSSGGFSELSFVSWGIIFLLWGLHLPFLISVTTKRLHDLGYNGWYQLLGIITFPLLTFILAFHKGDPYANKYGSALSVERDDIV